MFKFGSKNNTAPAESVKDRPKKRLVLQIGTMGWVATMLDDAGATIGQPSKGEGGNYEVQGPERIDKIIHNAVDELSRGPLKEADVVSVLVEGPRIVFSDSKQEGLRAASDATARMFGQRMLNAPTTQAVTFGYAPFGPDPDGELAGQEKSAEDQKSTVSRRPSVYAFADVRRIRSILSLFDLSALKVVSLVPEVYPILRKSAKEPDQTFGAILLGSEETTIILAHYNLHGVMVRTSPVGILTLAREVSEKAGIGVPDAMENLGKRDLVSKIAAAAPGSDKGLTTNPYQAGLEPGLRLLLSDIQESLEYFMSQRVCGRPFQLECYGEIGRINGLDRWLTKLLQLDVVPATQQPSALFAELCTVEECNLLRGAETSLISVGKVKYSFSQTGFVKTSALATQAQSVSSVKAGSGRLGRGDSRTRGRRRGQSDKQQEMGFLESIVAKLRGGSPQEGVESSGEEAADAAQSEMRKGAFIVFALVSLLLYWGYDQYLLQKKVHTARVAGYLYARDANTELLKSVGDARMSTFGAKSEEANKIFWTEKFIALSQAMNQHIWLTDLYLTSAQMELAGAKVETKKLVMEGAVLPSWDGHIGRMAEFLATLSDQTNNVFMSDFRQITFRGSSLDRGDDVVHFGFEAWYDRNKRVEDERKKMNSGDLSGNIQAIQDSTKAKEGAIRGVVK